MERNIFIFLIFMHITSKLFFKNTNCIKNNFKYTEYQLYMDLN